MSLAGIAIRRPVATTMLMVSMVFIGIVSMLSMKSELLPNMNIPIVMVSTTWQGAVPQDIETQVTKRIEDTLSNVDGIKQIRSTSAFGSSKVLIEFDYGVDINTKKGDVQKEVDTIKGDLPASAEDPFIKKIQAGAGNLTMMINVSGPNLLEVNTFVNEFMKPRFERIKGVGTVDVTGSADKQVQIQIDSDKLSAYNMTPIELYDLVKGSSLNVPLGVINTGGKEVVARFMGEINYVDDYKNMIIRSNGQTLRLRDVANVVLTTEDPESSTKMDGKQAVSISIEKSADGNTIDIADAAKKSIDEMQAYLPPGVSVDIIMDYSTDINSAISGVKGNAVTGLILASIILMVFLKNFRATLLISLALPIAIMFTFVFLASQGVTINVISLMGLSIGVGMLTDNSVVVIDNIYRHITELKKPVIEAAEDGATEVTIAIIASALTTMVVFIPVLFIPGIAREIFRDMSLAIIFSNVAALIVSLTLMPMVASRFLKSNVDITKEGKIFSTVKANYIKLIGWAVKNKIKTVGVAFGLFVVMMIVGAKATKTKLLPDQDFGKFGIILELPKGLSLETSEAIAKKAEAIVMADPDTVAYTTLTQKGVIILNVDIGEKSERDRSMFKIMDDLRPALGEIRDTKLNIKPNFQSKTPERDVEMRISAENLETAREIARKVQTKISKNSKIIDIKSTLDPGNTEARVVLHRDKLRSYGMNPADLGRTISYSFLGGDKGKGETVTVKTGTEEIDVLIRLSDKDRRKMSSLEQLNVRTADGKFIKVSDVADIVMAEGASEINKVDKIYSISIGANDGGLGLSGVQKAMVDAFDELEIPKGVSYTWGGNSQMFTDAIMQMGIALSISIFLIYAILAAQFENFVLPFIIIGSVPLAMIGVYTGLILTGQPFDLMVMIGIIMLAGTVVNNAIVLIDFIKILRERGMSVDEAVQESCKTRLRPIIMTTMTTVFGMIPLALGLGEGAELYSGMSIAVIFGLSFSTLLTLVVIPVLYVITEEMGEKAGKLFRKISKFKKKK